MYEELYIKFKNGRFDYYSPLEEMKLERVSKDEIKITSYGTICMFDYNIDLTTVESLEIDYINEDTLETMSSILIYNEATDAIFEFDNLCNSTYGILK